MKLVPKCEDCNSTLESIAFIVETENKRVMVHLDYCPSCEYYLGTGKRHALEDEFEAVKEQFEWLYQTAKHTTGEMKTYKRYGPKATQ